VALDAGERALGVVVDVAGGRGEEGVVRVVVEGVEEVLQCVEVVDAGQDQQARVERVPVGVGVVLEGDRDEVEGVQPRVDVAAWRPRR
jgi:hypothetical protein